MNRLEFHIAFIQRQFKLNLLLKSALLAGILFVLAWSLEVPLWASCLFFMISFGFSAYFLGVFKENRKQAIQHLHHQFPGLQYSLELAEKKEKNPLEILQWERVNREFQGKPTVFFHQKLLPFFLAFLISFSALGLKNLDWSESGKALVQISRENQGVDGEDLKVILRKINIQLTPPAYTGLKTERQTKLDIKAMQGSTVKWELDFSHGEDLEVFLINAAGEKLDFQSNAGLFSLSDKISGSGIYAIRAMKGEELVFDSGFFPLESLVDQAPVIVPAEKEVYKFHLDTDPKVQEVKAKVSDDFLVTQVYLVATLARGSGENVKFRENRIPVSNQQFQNSELRSVLDLKALDFQMGDELYYYWAAIDNKYPEANFSRSDTYFIRFLDPNSMSEAEMEGMAIHVLPEYFRSQRQIIIDTEKLIAQKKSTPTQTFNATSNEIGYDQKLLRLRYGQYLGEEFESGAGGGTFEPEESGDLLEGFMHKHDQEGEHEGGEVALAKSEEGHAHEHQNTDDAGSILDAFLHNHESEEMNTFFEASTKGILKMSLEQMWQSELYLRLFEPEKALPYQYKALEYLKSVQQKSRVYVKRTGFDPPPIKEDEKRLSGELKDLQAQIQKKQQEISEQLAPLAAKMLGMLAQESLSSMDQTHIQEFGSLWTQRMQYSGIQDWSVLLLVQKLAAGTLEKEENLELKRKLYSLAGNSKRQDASYLPQQELQKAFWQRLK